MKKTQTPPPNTLLSWSKCSSSDAVRSRLDAVNKTPEERQYDSIDGCVYSGGVGGVASPVALIINFREKW